MLKGVFDKQSDFNSFNIERIMQYQFVFKKIIFFVAGRQHEKMVGFCNCESNAATLVSLGLWPGSPTNPIVAFSIKFMDICLRFLLEAHVSLNKFCDAMSVFQTSLLPNYVSFKLQI